MFLEVEVISDNRRKIKPGNTLDYYNEDMSRKAVGKLFDALNQPKPQDDEMPYEHTYEQPDELNSTADPEYFIDDLTDFKRHESAFEPKLESNLESKAKPNSELKREYEKEKYSEREAAKESNPIQQEPRIKPKISSNEQISGQFIEKLVSKDESSSKRILDDFEYDLSIYRQKTSSSRRERNDGDFSSGGSSGRKHERSNEDERFEAASSSALSPLIKFGALAVFVVMLLILFVLIYKYNANNNMLKEANKTIEETNGEQGEITKLKLQNDELTQKLNEINTELDSIKEQVSGFSASSTETDASQNSNSTESNPQTPAPSNVNSNGDTVYVVKQGDNLSKISKLFYGNLTDYSKIMKANNLSSDSLVVGQVLVIPK